MFTHLSAFSGFSVDNLDRARDFYSNTLSLKVTDDVSGSLKVAFNDGTPVFIYPKDNHMPATYTVLNFVVEDIDQAVSELTQKGVILERYQGMGQDEQGIARGEAGQGPTAIAWFKDPGGNILSLIQA
jgi:catechol 2,3-dioxygenase-like lactoylglutathione lyase family enzyme